MAPERPLRILQVCSASRAVYGAVQSLMTLARAQRANGQIVEFATFKGKAFGDEVRAEGFQVHEVRVRAKIDPLAILHIRRLIKEGAYDLVHTHLSTSSVNGCLAARAARTPSIATVHGMSGRMSFVAATHLIAVSEGIKNHLVSQGAKPETISVVYNGYDVQGRACERPSEGRGYPVIGTVARLSPLKGIDDAIRAVAQLKADFPKISYLVVGDGVAMADLKVLAAEMDVADRVQFIGYRQDIETFLSQMDLFVFPSLKEGMGLALVEAMAQRLPVVATNIGGIPEVVTPACGILVPAKSPSELAEAVGRVLSDEALRESMSAAALARATSVFSVEAMLRATDEVYRKVMKTY